MARTAPRPQPDREEVLKTIHRCCPACGGRLSCHYDNRRAVVTLRGLVRLRLKIRRCENRGCGRHHQPYRPEAEGALVLPQHEFGLDVIALVGALRYREHRSVPEIHRSLRERGVAIAERSVTNLLDRYDELVATSLADDGRLRRASWPARAGRSWRSTACSRTSGTRCCGCSATACRARSCWPGACCRLDERGPRRPAARGRRRDWRAGRRRGQRRPALDPHRGRARPCPGCRTSCASSTTCARPRCRSSRPTGTPRRS